MAIPEHIKLKMAQSPYINWVETEENTICMDDKKLFIFQFDKVFDDPNLEMYNKFQIKKQSYVQINKSEKVSKLSIIVKYINCFMDLYDDDKELATAYFKLKYVIDKERLYNLSNIDAFIDLLYRVLFTETMIEKIHRICDESFIDDIEASTDEKYKMDLNKHQESLEFTNEHMRILLKISFAMKIMAPVMFHFININMIKLESDDMLLYRFYERLFSMFSDTVNIYNKLFVYVKAKVIDCKSHNKLSFEQQEIFGVDQYSVMNDFVKTKIISENLFKYEFPKVWNNKTNKFAENIVGFNKTIVKFQLFYFRKKNFEQKPVEVTSAKTSSDGLSGQDKLEMLQNKIDETLTILSDINIAMTLDKLRKTIDIPISKEEIDYHMKHWSPSPIQSILINNYFGKYFGNQRDLNLATRREKVELALLMKKHLLLDVSISDKANVATSILPFILTGNLMDTTITKPVKNIKFMNRIKDSHLWEELINHKYRMYTQRKPQEILDKICKLITNSFTYVCYDNQDLLGEEIIVDEDILADEVLFFLYKI